MRVLPYVLVAVGLLGGLAVVLFGPLGDTMNGLVGGALLAVALASVTYMITAHSGPGERGPDF